MSKGTIIYVGGFELPDKNAAAHRVFANSKLLSRIGFNVVLVGINKDMVDDGLGAKKRIVDEFEVWERQYPKSSFSWLDYFLNPKSVINIIRSYENVKTVICYNYQAIPMEIIRKYCKKNNINIISDTTEWYGGYNGNIFLKVIKAIDTNLRMRFINKRVDALILVSEYLKKYYENKVSVVIPTLIYKKDNLKPRYNLATTKIISYAGLPFNLGKKLNDRSLAKDRLDIAIDLLYRVMKKDVPFIFNIYGLTKDEYLQVLPDDKDIVEEMENCLFFYGRLSSNQIQEVVSQSDFTILIRDDNLTTKAGFPTKFTESINLNVPVITTNTSDLSQYLVEGKNGYFINLRNPHSDLDKLCDILSQDSSKLRKMKDYCYQTKIFSVEKWENDLSDSIQKLVNK